MKMSGTSSHQYQIGICGFVDRFRSEFTGRLSRLQQRDLDKISEQNMGAMDAHRDHLKREDRKPDYAHCPR